ncbi:hypothetical protein FRB93_001151 [Tulasnella sp. JGI-2019a]|nr:hypothetical protein FRB93_001151 [Tulasnella sp. JGI-2019a]
MPTAATQLPPSGTFLEIVRFSCRELRNSAKIQVTKESIHNLLLSPAFTESFPRLKLSHGVTFPLKFPSVVAELNLLAILSLLNFGSGYRAPLHACNGRGAWDNIRALVLSLYLSSSEEAGPRNPLSAQGMTTITREQIASYMNISLHVEAAHPSMPAVTVGQLGGPLLELAELITNTMKDTGNILVNNGYPDLGTFVMEALEEAKRAGAKNGVGPAAEIVVEKLVRAFPAFQDMAEVDGQPVYVFKKALFLVHAIVLRFQGASIDPTPATTVPIPDTTSLPIFSDNVIPSMLVHLGVLDVSSATSAKLVSAFPNPKDSLPTLFSLVDEAKSPNETELPTNGPHLAPEESYTLRAAAVDACEMIIAAAREIEVPGDKEKEVWLRGITLPELDGWLWTVAKDRVDYRRLPRFVARPTIFF